MRAKLTPLLSLLALLLCAACGSGLEETCTTLATTQCDECYSCGAQVDGVSGGELCGLDGAMTKAGCESTLSERCSGQTSARQNPSDDLQSCEDALGSQSCDKLIERFALDRRPEPTSCQLFF
jgi:hypothetical protein